MDSQRQKSCSQCGEMFGCTSGHGCWCQDVSLTKEQLQWIEAQYDNCLCPGCLTSMSKELNPGRL
ncbi:cysteine-rich CWC family protein [Candidatus Nitrospira salsa]